MKNEITQPELKEYLRYEPDSGLFFWAFTARGFIREGLQAGCICKCSGYVRICLRKRLYAGHRLAFLYMTGKHPPDQVDHLNGVRSDNRWSNLRAATCAENMRNQKLSVKNNSGTIGVSWRERDKRWRSEITVYGKRISLGSFVSLDEAVAARLKASIDYGFNPNHGLRKFGKPARGHSERGFW